MLKALWAVLTGANLTEIVGLAAAALILLAASFASGALWQASRDVRSAVGATPTAVAAQHNHDVQQHQVAKAADAAVAKTDSERDVKLAAILAALAAKPTPTEKTCDMPQDVVQLLNDAGH